MLEEHRSNVGTIEQILFKYSRERKWKEENPVDIYKQGWKFIHKKYKQNVNTRAENQNY